jgi:LytR cell envelope-related transcriptional attenuator
VDFPAPSSTGYTTYQSDQRSWRTAAIVTAAIAAVELIVLLVVVLAFVVKPFAGDSSATRSANAVDEAAATLLPRAKTPVLVLNGNGVAGAAGTTAKRVRALDYPITDVGDASRRNFTRTIVMFREGARAEAVRLARDLGFTARRVVPLDGMREPELLGAQVAVIVGRRG